MSFTWIPIVSVYAGSWGCIRSDNNAIVLVFPLPALPSTQILNVLSGIPNNYSTNELHHLLTAYIGINEKDW